MKDLTLAFGSVFSENVFSNNKSRMLGFIRRPLRVDIKEFFLIVLLSILSLASANECSRVGFYVLRVLN